MSAHPLTPKPARTIACYAGAIAIVSISNFLSVPILVQLIGVEEFGRWALVEPVILAATPLALFGIQFGAIKLISRDNLSGRAAISALLPLILPALIGVALLAAAVAALMGEKNLAIWVAGIVFFEAILLLAISVWRAEGKAHLYAIAEGGRAVTILAALAAALFIANTTAQAEHYLWLRLAAAFAAFALAMSIIRPKPRPAPHHVKQALSYGAPLVAGTLLAVGLINAERYFIAAFTNTTQLTTYVAHLKISLTVSFAVQAPFATWFMPQAIRRAQDHDQGREFFSKIWITFIAVLVWVAGNIWILAPKIWPYIFPTIQFDPTLFTLLLLSSCIYAIWTILAAGTFQPGKTKWMAPIVGAALAALLIAGYPLTQGLALNGAALARLAGLSVHALLFAWASSKILGISWPVAQPLAICLSALLALMASGRITIENPLYLTVADMLIFNTLFALFMLILLGQTLFGQKRATNWPVFWSAK